VQEGAASSGAVHEAGGGAREVALAHVASELRRSDTVPAHTVLEQLPWLLERSPEASLGVLTERELPVHQVCVCVCGGGGGWCRGCRGPAPAAALARRGPATQMRRHRQLLLLGLGRRGGLLVPYPTPLRSTFPPLPMGMLRPWHPHQPPLPFAPAPAQVLEILAGRSDDLRWQYLQHQVHSRGLADPLLHTELALLLAESIQAAVQAGGLSAEQVSAAAPGAAPEALLLPQTPVAGRSPAHEGRSGSGPLGVK
jgi:hypothetical protein